MFPYELIMKIFSHVESSRTIRSLHCTNKRFSRLKGRLCYMCFKETDTAVICKCNTHDDIPNLKQLDDDSWRAKLIFLSYPVCHVM